MRKRVLGLCMALALCFSLFPAPISADEIEEIAQDVEQQGSAREIGASQTGVIPSSEPSSVDAVMASASSVSKMEETPLGKIYTLYIVDSMDETVTLRKDLYRDGRRIETYVDDFFVDGADVFYSAMNRLMRYDMVSDEITQIATGIHLYDLQVIQGYLCGIDALNGMAQLYAVSLDSYQLTPTNYTGVNAYRYENGQLYVEMAVQPEVYAQEGSQQIEVLPSAATQRADEVESFEDGLENIMLQGAIADEESDFDFLSATVTLLSIQPAILDLPRLYVTQGANGSYSHTSKNVFDIDASYSGRADIKAPFDGTVRFIASQEHAIWFESNDVVQYANGTVSKLTVLTMHDNDVSDLSSGKTFRQGEVYTQEGDYGNATGIHMHIECINGGAGSSAWAQRGNVLPNNALYLSSSTKIDNAGGVKWEIWNGTPPPHTTHEKGAYQWYEASHPHYHYWKCSICGELFTDGSTAYVDTCSDCIEPGKPALTGMKSAYAFGEAVVFQWGDTVNTTHNNLYIDRKINSSDYERIENILYAEKGISRTFEAGEYRALIQSTNSNSWAQYGDDWTWRYTNGDWVSFTVNPHTTHEKGAYQWYEAAHPHYHYWKCSICEELFTDGSTEAYVESCETCNPHPQAPDTPSVSINGRNVTVSWNAVNHASRYDVYLVQEPWRWADIKYSDSTQSTSHTFSNVAYGTYRAFVIARPNEDTVQSGWAEVIVSMPQLDLSAYLDEHYSLDFEGYGTVDVYINGSLVADDVFDYHGAFQPGTSYEIKDIKPNDGYAYNGVYHGTRTGTIGDDNLIVFLNFSTIDTINLPTPSKTEVFNGHSYQLYTEPVTWYTAKKLCEAMGGHLVTITSEEENQFVLSLRGTDWVWIGATDAAKEGTWEWVSGEPFAFNKWASEEPNDTKANDEGSENYAHQVYDDGVWNDTVGCNKYAFICEIDSTLTLDVNGWLDGTEVSGLGDYGTVDVYVNGSLVADNVSDYYVELPIGASYEIKSLSQN